MSADLVIVPSEPTEPNPLGDRSKLLADLLLTFEAAAQARGAPSDEVRQGQVALLQAFGLLGGDTPLTIVPELEPALPTDRELIKGYERFQRRRGLRPNTVLARRRMLDKASRDLPNGLAGAKKGELEKWLDRHTLSNHSRRAYLCHFRSFYTWAVDDDLLPADPTKKIVGSRGHRSVPRPMPTSDLVLALDNADPKMRAMLLIGCYGGLRCCEIAGLDREDVLEDGTLLRITQGKGGHERVVPLHPDTLAALNALPMPESGPIFRTPQGRIRFSAWAMSRSINDYLHSLGIKSTAHCLRHFFGTAIYGITQDIRLTQELLGHANVNTTAVYTQADQTKSAPAVLSLSALISGLSAKSDPGAG